MILISHYILIDMSGSLNITLNTSNGSLHLSDLHVTDPSQLNDTTIESISFYIPQDNSDIVPFNAEEEPIPHTGDEVHYIGHEVHGFINDNIPFTATLNGANDSMSIGELNNSFSNSSFTRDKTDDESELSFSLTDESTGGKKKRSTKKRKGKKKRTTKKRKGKKKKKTMRKQRKRSKKRRGGYDGKNDDEDDSDDDDKLNASFADGRFDPIENKPVKDMYNIMNPHKIENYIKNNKKNPTLGIYHIDDLPDNYEKYEKKYNVLQEKLSELEEQNGEEAKKIKKFMEQLKDTLQKMNKVNDQQSYAILFNYYIDTKYDKYNIHVNSAMEYDITELQQRYNDYIDFEAHEGITFGGKKKRKKNKSKKKQKK